MVLCELFLKDAPAGIGVFRVGDVTVVRALRMERVVAGDSQTAARKGVLERTHGLRVGPSDLWGQMAACLWDGFRLNVLRCLQEGIQRRPCLGDPHLQQTAWSTQPTTHNTHTTRHTTHDAGRYTMCIDDQ